jgi:hypothetical protein
MDNALPACTLRALAGIDPCLEAGVDPLEWELATGVCFRCGHSELRLVAEAVRVAPFLEALARGGGFVVLCSNILIEQKMQVTAKMLMASIRTHINPPMLLPA